MGKGYLLTPYTEPLRQKLNLGPAHYRKKKVNKSREQWQRFEELKKKKILAEEAYQVRSGGRRGIEEMKKKIIIIITLSFSFCDLKE
jgi:hypothetical protein